MTRTLRAFVWLRWRLVLNSLGGSRRRDRLEQLSRALAMAVPVVLVTLAFGSVVATTVMGFVVGRALATGLAQAPTVVLVLRGVLFAMLIVLVIFAVTSPVQASLTRYTRLLLLPISRRLLHLIEVLASLADPWIVFLAPGLLAFAVGLSVGGRTAAGFIAAGAALAMLAVLATLAALAGFLVAWLMRSRRRSELFTLVFVILLSVGGFLPIMIAGRAEADREAAERAGIRRSDRSVEIRPDRTGRRIVELERTLPVWTRVLPSELYGRAVLAGAEGVPGRAALAIAGLAAEAAVLFGLSSLVHRRLIGSSGGESRRAVMQAVAVSNRRVPGLSASVSAVAMAQLRTATRSVRGRLVILLSGPMLAGITLLLRSIGDDTGLFVHLGQHGYALFGLSMLMALFSAQPFSMNLFGADRAGLTLQFLLPVSDAELARGKVVGVGLLLAAAGALALVAVLLVAPAGRPTLWIAALLGSIATYLIISPAAIWLSALFPVASDLSKSGSGGNPHALASLVGMILSVAAALPVVAIFGVTVWILKRPELTLPITAVWTALAAAIALPLITVASRTIAVRRENLALVAQHR